MLFNLRLKQIKRRWLISVSPQYAMNIGQRILWCNSRHFNISMLAQLNDCIGGLLHLGPNVITLRTILHLGLNVITFRALSHLGPNVITFRTLLHLGQLLHLGLQHHFALFLNYLFEFLRESINGDLVVQNFLWFPRVSSHTLVKRCFTTFLLILTTLFRVLR